MLNTQKRLQRSSVTHRAVFDWIATQIIRIGGVFVVFAVLLIFLYLLYKVFPLFSPPDIQASDANHIDTIQDKTSPLYFGVDEYSSILFATQADGQVHYSNLKDDTKIPSEPLIPDFIDNKRINTYALITQLPYDSYALVTKADEKNQADVFIVGHQYTLSYPNNERKISPKLVHPWGERTLKIAGNSDKIALREDDDRVIIAASLGQSISLYHYAKTQSLLGDDIDFELDNKIELSVNHSIDFLTINFDLRWLVALSKEGEKTFFPLFEEDIDAHRQELSGTDKGITVVKWLLGEISLLIGNRQGEIEQWFPVRQDDHITYQRIRTFTLAKAPISSISSERLRKGFVAADETGNAGIFYSSSENHLGKQKVAAHPIVHIVVSPGDDHMFFLDAKKQWHYWQVNNPHPEGNFKQIWQKIHYENYEKPKYLWQSSAANQDFEPKFSLTPLLFGTIKGAFYALFFAIPLAILGAIYTAFFMSKNRRRYVKPTIEIMEALPTVILGFLAGLWMAPFVEKNLMFLFLIFLLMPLGILFYGFFSSQLTTKNQFFSLNNRFIALLPALCVFLVICQLLSTPIQNLFFAGDLRQYITREWGIDYNQRNALVVGFAMGFAVIPTIFSITEDAIYSVPKHLVNGSLAMGASPWQTLTGVVIPTASPAIFSAIMIGLGRAVGETMIVLMATGNTAVMDFNIFEGMRTLSANIAVEMPESEVDSSHFRILFLAALVLFMLTFVFNTIAESIRLRLKKKYAEL